MKFNFFLFASILLFLATTATSAPLAPGYGKLEYLLPAAGSYQLPPLGVAADGEVLDAEAKSVRLHQVFNQKIVLLSFIYSRCSDVNGCPLSNYVFYRLKAEMRRDPVLAERFKLISLSFDPENDTPETLRLYSTNFEQSGDAGEWQFLTTKSEQALLPILELYQQDIQRQFNDKAEATDDISHILRVFLIDSNKRIRNIYSVAFLHPELLLNDIRTLLMEEEQMQEKDSTLITASNITASLSRAGDDKQGYSRKDYKTRSQSLNSRKGQATDLLKNALNPPLGLPAINTPENNPLTKEKISLGRRLFYDRRLSLNSTFSCAMCHIPEQGFTSNELGTAIGIEGRTVRRNTPTIYNVAYAEKLFHDGREENLEQQVWGPLLAKNEMGNPSIGAVLKIIRQIPGYTTLFKAAFNGKGPDMETTGMALAAYQRTLVSADSAFDRWHYGKQEHAITTATKHGFKLFTGKAQCVNCHKIGPDNALFTDQQMHNTGIGYLESMGLNKRKESITLAPGVTVDVDQSIIDSVGEPPPTDLGLYEITQNPDDRWKYKTPSLRNIALTAPYMHNGSFLTLQEVIEFYNQGGIANEVLSPLIKPLHLSGSEKSDLLAFLQSLTGSNVDELIADAFAAPVGDITVTIQ